MKMIFPYESIFSYEISILKMNTSPVMRHKPKTKITCIGILPAVQFNLMYSYLQE